MNPALPYQARRPSPAPSLASTVWPAAGHERPSQRVAIATFAPVIGVPVLRTSLPPAPLAPMVVRPAFMPSERPASALASSASNAKTSRINNAWEQLRGAYVGSRPSAGEGIVFLVTVVVTFSFVAAILSM